MRVALYCRCSTLDQSVDLQLDGLRDYAKARGFAVVEEYVDEGVSGARARRPAVQCSGRHTVAAGRTRVEEARQEP